MKVVEEDSSERFEERNYTFPCSEHYWWAEFMHRPEDIERLAVGGDLSAFNGLKILLGDFSSGL